VGAGRPAAQVWSEIWHICGPLADIVFVEGDATMADDVRRPGSAAMQGNQVMHERQANARAFVGARSSAGYGSDSDRLRSGEVGFDQHLVKPINMEEVEAFLHP
jgi:CheY-like chemotaxis protein